MSAKIRSDFASRFNSDPLRSYTLPGRWHREPGSYEQERENIFFQTWRFIGFVADLKEAGAFIRLCSLTFEWLQQARVGRAEPVTVTRVERRLRERNR